MLLHGHHLGLERQRAQAAGGGQAGQRGLDEALGDQFQSGQSRRAASSYRESVASTPGPAAGSSSAALELARPVR